MRVQQLLEFWSAENPCCIQLEEAICLAATVLLKEGATYSAGLKRRVERYGYFHISGRILNQTLVFLVENGICRKETPQEHHLDRLNAIRPKFIYVLQRTPANIQICQELKDVWDSRILPRNGLQRKRSLGLPESISA